MLPDLPTALPPPSLAVLSYTHREPASTSLSSQEIPPAATCQSHSSDSSQANKILRSTPNMFGLSRHYHTSGFLGHDPDKNLTFDDLVDTSCGSSPNPPIDSYYPYPNQSSFLLGEWFWDGGVQKSQSSFKNLLKIVGHPDFRPEDVSRTSWRRIDAQLCGDSRSDDLNDNEDGEDGEDGKDSREAYGGWVEKPIKIYVPFHKRTLHPGQEEFEVGTLRYRKLTSVIREKISRTHSNLHFHLEPYELYWQPNQARKPVRVHGELYSSKAFIDAHRDLQKSPGETGCNLPKVIVGLMFASDGTQLTTFSNAKLWPVYLAFGNESKYRRSKPSCQAFEHIAYLASVSTVFVKSKTKLEAALFHSFQMPSSLLCRNVLVGRGPPTPLWPIVSEKRIMPSGISSSTTNSWRRTCTAL
jgi:hypothetical protein